MEFSRLLKLLTYFILTVCVFASGSKVKILNRSRNTMCGEVPKTVLSEVLGSAFNSRYMSVAPPPKDPEPNEGMYKRNAGGIASFYEDDTFAQDISDQPAWPRPDERVKLRRKRSTLDQWRCETKLRWMDLGPNYFPQFLRSVECISKDCWYGMFKCKPRSFTVKLLRKKPDRCVVAKTGTSLGFEGLPVDLRELWVWEERAVNFCCDCAL